MKNTNTCVYKTMQFLYSFPRSLVKLFGQSVVWSFGWMSFFFPMTFYLKIFTLIFFLYINEKKKMKENKNKIKNTKVKTYNKMKRKKHYGADKLYMKIYTNV